MTSLLIGITAVLVTAAVIWWLAREGRRARTAAARATDDKKDLQRDIDNAERITRAVDAVRGVGPKPDRMREPERDTRGYRD